MSDNDETFSLEFDVQKAHTVPELMLDIPNKQKMPEVLSTPYLVGMAEVACIGMIARELGEDAVSLGAGITIRHLAPTPAGFRVTVTVRLLESQGRKRVFAFTARDEIDEIGNGSHTRIVVDPNAAAKSVATRIAARSKEP